MEEEAHGDVVCAWVRRVRDGRVGNQFPHQAGRVVRHAEEVGVCVREVRQAEVAEHASVGAELDVQHVLAFARDGAVEGGHDLGGDDGARDCADRFGCVVCEPEFMLVREGAELEEVCVVGQRGAGVVDVRHVQEVEDRVGVFEAALILGEGAFDVGVHAVVEALCAGEGALVLSAEEVIVGADWGSLLVSKKGIEMKATSDWHVEKCYG